MKVKGLDGKIYTLDLIHVNSERLCSTHHDRARSLLKDIFPTDKIWEEVSLPGTKPILFADFLLPFRKMIVEVHGPQHYEWIDYFHPTKRDFLIAQQNDKNKQNWSKLNNFVYIELPHMEDLDAWRNRIINFGL